MGVGMFGSMIVAAIGSRTAIAKRMVPSLVGLAVLVLCYGNVRSDAAVLARSARLDHPRALLQRAAAAGVFDALPEGSIIAVPAMMPFAVGIHSSGIDARYAIFHYAKRRFDTIAADQKDWRPIRGAWLLQTDSPTGMFVSLSHLTGGSELKADADRAIGFTTFEDIWKPALQRRRGLSESVRRLRDGYLLNVRRRCGPVPLERVYEADGPMLQWGEGFYFTGPVGYVTPKSPWLYPKVFMGMRAVLNIIPSHCPPTAVNLKAVAVSGEPSTLIIRSPDHTDRIATSAVPALFWLRYAQPSERPIRIVFQTDAPRTDFDPVQFRYERDRPRNIRIVMQPAEVWEDLVAPRRSAPLTPASRRRGGR